MKQIFTVLFAVVALAAMAENEAPVNGFSISATQQVVFAQGNLQFHMKDSVWRFAPNQWDWIGNANLEMGNPDYDGWVDLFCWSVGADNNYGATSNNDTLMCANKDFVDWGELFENEWFTLSRAQWEYVLNKRTDAEEKWGMAKIGDTLGMILLPDTWTAPEGILFVPRTIPTSEFWGDDDMIDDSGDHYRVKNADMPANLFSEADWAQLAAAGAIFLPYAGRRTGGFGNYLNRVCETVNYMYRFSYYENYAGTYWTSTVHNREKGQADYIYTFKHYVVNKEEFYEWGKNVIWSENGRYGQSVRLAMRVEDIPTRVDALEATSAPRATKRIVNGQLLIERNGQRFNATGAPLQ